MSSKLEYALFWSQLREIEYLQENWIDHRSNRSCRFGTSKIFYFYLPILPANVNIIIITITYCSSSSLLSSFHHCHRHHHLHHQQPQGASKSRKSTRAHWRDMQKMGGDELLSDWQGVRRICDRHDAFMPEHNFENYWNVSIRAPLWRRCIARPSSTTTTTSTTALTVLLLITWYPVRETRLLAYLFTCLPFGVIIIIYFFH